MMIKMNAQDLWLNMDDDGHLTRARDDYSQATLYVHAKRFGQVLNRAEAAEAEVAALRARLGELQEQFDFLDAGHDPRSMLEEALNQVESENAALRSQLAKATAWRPVTEEPIPGSEVEIVVPAIYLDEIDQNGINGYWVKTSNKPEYGVLLRPSEWRPAPHADSGEE